jgi:tetratricopeptide (TPR) repeat protein
MLGWTCLVLAGAGLAFGQTIAALPFANVSPTAAAASASPSGASTTTATGASASPVNPSPSLDWIGESIAETLRDALGARGITAHARQETNEAFQRLNLKTGSMLTRASALKVGERLDAEYVIYGTFEFTPAPTPAGLMTQGTLKIVARILDRQHLRQSPEFVETGNLDDLAALEAHLAWRTIVLIAPKRAPAETDYKSLNATVRLDAQESYIRGLMARSPEQQEKLLLQAARLDARFAHPLLQLGRMYLAQKEYKKAAESLQKVSDTDGHSSEANFLLGLALFQSGDAVGAEKVFQTVANTVPLSEVWNDLGAAQNRLNSPQATDAFKKALEGDPNDPVYIFNLGYSLWKRGDFTAAADRFRAVLARQPDDQMATLLLGMCLKKQAPRPTDARLLTLERLKTNYEERAYWQLKSLVEATQ